MKLIKWVLFVAIWGVFGVNMAWAAPGINKKINFQAKVVKTDGTNVADGNYDVIFKIWNAASAGSTLWSEVWNSGSTQVNVVTGIFNVDLGTYETFSPTLFDSDSLFLSIGFSGEADMEPRIQYAAVPYAVNAEKVAGLTVTNTTGTLTIPNGKTISFNDNFTVTGVGVSLNQSLMTTDSPNFAGLSIASTAVTATAKEINYLAGLPVGSTGAILYTSGVGITQLNIGASGLFLLSDGTRPVWSSVSVGAGTTYAFENGLTKSGTNVVSLGGTLTVATSIGVSSFGLSFLGINNNTQALYIGAGGYIGIGTTSPGYKLDVRGEVNDYLANIYNVGTSASSAGLYIRSDGNGNVLGVNQNGVEMMTVSGIQSAFNNPVAFNTGGDVGIVYDLIFTNQSASFIQSNASLYLEAGEVYESNSLTLRTFNAGNIVFDIGPSGTALFGLGTTGIGIMAQFGDIGAGGTGPFVQINRNGQIGIGITNPTKKLEIAGDIKLSGTVFVGAGVTGENGQVLSSDGAGSLAWITPGGATYYANNGLTMNGTTVGLGGTLGGAVKIGVSSFDLTFLGINNNTQTLYVGATGYVGIGTTNPAYKLEVTGDVMISQRLGIGSTNSLYTLNVGGTGGFVDMSLSGLLVIGTGTSTFTFNPASGPLYTGNARPSRKIVLSPEFAGAAMSADGSTSVGGTMTSDNVLNAGGSGWKNYYEWSSGNAALQDYSVIVRITLPSDFDTWEAGSCPGVTCGLEFYYQTGVGTTDDNNVSYTVTNDTDTPGSNVCSVGVTASQVWGSSGCTEAVLNDGGAPEWDAAGETAVVRIKLAAKSTSSALTRAGDIILRYKSKF